MHDTMHDHSPVVLIRVSRYVGYGEAPTLYSSTCLLRMPRTATGAPILTFYEARVQKPEQNLNFNPRGILSAFTNSQ